MAKQFGQGKKIKFTNSCMVVSIIQTTFQNPYAIKQLTKAKLEEYKQTISFLL